MHGPRHRSRGRRGGLFGARIPSRAQLLELLMERQRDLEQEIADIHDLIARLSDPGDSPATRPQPAV